MARKHEYSQLGFELNKRLPFSCKRKELAYQENLKKIEESILQRIEQYKSKNDKKMLRHYERSLWALNATKLFNIDMKAILPLFTKFEKLDLIPTHYNYPELYQL